MIISQQSTVNFDSLCSGPRPGTRITKQKADILGKKGFCKMGTSLPPVDSKERVGHRSKLVGMRNHSRSQCFLSLLAFLKFEHKLKKHFKVHYELSHC
jgi:hypothetical protein